MPRTARRQPPLTTFVERWGLSLTFTGLVREFCKFTTRNNALMISWLAIDSVISSGKLTKQEGLVLRGRLGFANSCLHGRLGNLVLKLLVEHAYSPGVDIDSSLRMSLVFMKERLVHGKPREVGCKLIPNWFLFTDASYEQNTKTGGIGAVLVDNSGSLCSWFGIQLDKKCMQKIWR